MYSGRATLAFQAIPSGWSNVREEYSATYILNQAEGDPVWDAPHRPRQVHVRKHGGIIDPGTALLKKFLDFLAERGRIKVRILARVRNGRTRYFLHSKLEGNRRQSDL
jgi:hypothetical protein